MGEGYIYISNGKCIYEKIHAYRVQDSRENYVNKFAWNCDHAWKELCCYDGIHMERSVLMWNQMLFYKEYLQNVGIMELPEVQKCETYMKQPF